MAKRKRTIRAGNLVKTVIYTVPHPRDPDHVRAAKSRATTAAQRALNYRTAQGKLEMLLAANFGPQDLFCTLTYDDAHLPTTHASAKARIQSFIRTLRSARRKHGSELKYVYVTEGRHGDKRYHHHIVINASGLNDLEAICSLWTYGEIVEIERIGTHEYIDIARYITKESAEGKPVGAQMWTPSRNLEKPTVESCYVQDNETITPPPGAFILEKEERVNEFGGFLYLKYRLPVVNKPFHPRPAANKRKHRTE